MAASVTPSLIAEYEHLLGQMMIPNTEVVRAAGAELENRLKTSAAAIALLQLIINHPQIQIRHLAGIILRMKAVSLWAKMDAEAQKLMKDSLLQALVREPQKPVRNGIADVVGIVARITVPSNAWPELLDFLFQCTNSQNVEHREVGMKLFDSLTDNIGDILRPHTKTLYNIFARGLTDSDNNVRVASLKAVGSLVDWVTTDEEIKAFGDLLPSMLHILSHCLQNGLYDESTCAFEIFNELIESPLPVVVPHIVTLTRAMLEIGANRSIDLSVREMALTVVQWITSYKSKALTQNQLLIPSLQVAFAMCNEFSEEEEDDDDDDDDGMYLPAHEFGAQMIDHFSLTLSAKKIFPPCIEFVKHFLQSSKPNERRAALTVLTVLAEGCADAMSENLAPLLEFVYRGFSDPSQKVREAACICIGQFAAHLVPDIIDYHEKVLPMLIQCLQDTNREIIVKACYALESFVGPLDEQVLPYLDALTTRLLELLGSADIEVREMVLPALSALAEAADRAFLPYYPKTMELVQAMMNLDKNEHLSLRCRATECAGILATAAGKEVFQPVAELLVHLACEGMKLEDCELREYTHGFFANVAECLGSDFKKYLPLAVPLASASCLSDEGLVFYKETGEDIAGITEDSEFAQTNVGAPEAYFDEKSSATRALGEFAKHTGADFMPYLPKTMEVLVEMSKFGFTDVRKNAIGSLTEFVEATHKAFPPAQPIQMGVSASQQPPLPEQTRHVLETTLKILIHAMGHDEDKTVVSRACSAYGVVAKLVGPPGIESTFPKAAAALEAVVKGRATCHKVEQEEFEDEDVAEEREVAFIDNVADCLMDVASVYGPYWEPYFKKLLPSLMDYLERSPDFTVVIVGLLAETSKALKQAVIPYLKQFLQIALKALGHDEDQIKRNAAYMCGALCQSAGAESVQYYQEILRRLVPLFASTEPALSDNACGAAARMILNSPESVPLEHVLPLMYKALPIKVDFEESENVYNSIFFLFSTNHKVLGMDGVIPMTVNIFSQALANPRLPASVQNTMVMLLKALAQKNTAFMQQIIAHLPAPQQQTLAKYLQ